MSSYEIVATVLSLIYIVLAVANKPLCFVFGIFASLIWGYVSFSMYNLVFDAILQFFYVGMSVWGILLWKSEGDKEELPIRNMTMPEHAISIAAGIGLGFMVAYLTGLFYDANWPYLDSLTTAFLMIATYWLVQRKLECWIYFIIADAVYIYIYHQQGATLFAWMMVVYTIMAALGYYQWKREMKA